MSQVKMNPKGKLNEIDQNTLLINQPFSLYLEKIYCWQENFLRQETLLHIVSHHRDL